MLMLFICTHPVSVYLDSSLLKAMNLSPTSSATQILITSSAKYGLTKGSFVADYLELTPEGKIASDKSTAPRDLAVARCNLAIKRIKPFDLIYERYKGKKLPATEVMKDALTEAGLKITDLKECIDLFIVNASFIGLLQPIAGSETLVPLEVLVEQIPSPQTVEPTATTTTSRVTSVLNQSSEQSDAHSDTMRQDLLLCHSDRR